MTELERMIKEDLALACKTCLGNGTLASCESIVWLGKVVKNHQVKTCEACNGLGVKL